MSGLGSQPQINLGRYGASSPLLRARPPAGHQDEIGVELPNREVARAEATCSLADIARDMSPDTVR